MTREVKVPYARTPLSLVCQKRAESYKLRNFAAAFLTFLYYASRNFITIAILWLGGRVKKLDLCFIDNWNVSFADKSKESSYVRRI